MRPKRPNKARPVIPQRRRFFVGCEGESEQAYARILGRIAGEMSLAVHLDAVLLQPGGGDPLEIVELAAERIAEREARHGAYAHRCVFLDNDTLHKVENGSQRVLAAARNAGLHLVWQRPCHEAMLLRHLQGCERLRPQTTAVAQQNLVRHWPSYEKAMSAVRLAERLDQAAIFRAATVEPDLAILLQALGLI